MVWAIASQHRVAPHDESPGVIVTAAHYEVPQDHDPYTYVNLTFEQSVAPHESHFDTFAAHGMYKLSHFAGIDKIEGFALIMVGDHSDNPDLTIQIDLKTVQDFLNGSGDSSYSVGALSVNPSTGAMDGTIAINDQPLGQFIQATLNLGGPNQNGPVIYNLGGQALWSSRRNGTSISRDFTGQFPQQYLGALLNGQVYFHVTNTQYPFGSIRGQLNRTPYGVRATSVNVIRGSLAAGSVVEVENSDNTRLTIQKNGVPQGDNSAPIQVQFIGWSWVKNPQSLKFQFETGASIPNAVERVYLLNQATNVFEPIDRRQITQSEHSYEVVIMNQPSRFIKPDGTVVAKMTFEQPGPGATKAWTASIDRIHWTMVR
jgi:hypothetical protein